MRVLVTSTPGTGHVFPLLALADALRAAGHSVLWAVAGDGEQLVRRHGFDVAVAGMNLGERLETLRPRLPDIMSRPPRLRRGHLFAGFFASGAAPKMVHELGPLFERFRPDVVVHETAELGAAPQAVARGIPHVTVAFSGGLPGHAIPLVEAAIEPVWTGLGLSRPSASDLAGDVYLHPFPASMGQAPDIGQVRPMRPTEVPGAHGAAPDWIESFGRDRPAIYVTAGTTPVVATLAPWRPTFEALGSLDVDVLATIGPQLPIDELGPLPVNVRVERFVPQALLLDRVAVVVSHAGAGTLLGAASRGVPQLLIPTWADQWENADAIALAGSGVVLEDDRRGGEAIHAAVQRLLHDETYRVAASCLAEEIAAMPSPADHVITLERLVSDR